MSVKEQLMSNNGDGMCCDDLWKREIEGKEKRSRKKEMAEVIE